MTTVDVGIIPDLNPQQVEVIVAEALSAGFFELGPQGQKPQGDALKEAARELVRQCRLAHHAGNRNPAINSILFAAEVDLSPPPRGDQSVSSSEDITTYTPELLLKLEETLRAYPPSDEVTQNLALVRGEIQRRGLPLEGENGGAPAAPAAEAAQAMTPQEIAADQATVRKTLLGRLTFPIMRVHGVDPSDIPSLTDSQLRWIVDHPSGAGPVEATAPPPPVIPEPRGETIETTRMVVPPSMPVVPDDPPPSVPTPSRVSDVSAERLAMEEQVTGPMLKAFGRGRNDVASGAIGDNELAFMLANPDGRVTQETLLGARALDQASVAPVVVPAQARPLTIAEQIAATKKEVQVATPDTSGFAPVAAGDDAAVVESSPPAPSVVKFSASVSQTLPTNPIQETIDREKFPVPSEIDEVVRLPFDLTKLSEEEVYSHHSRAHAIHVRVAYVLGLWESELRDEVKLRRGREIHVANNLPVKDGRVKLTDAQREAMVQADEEVVAHREKEHEIEKIVRQLRGLESNYSADVSACSRQLNRFERERAGSR